jgi:hypothetical protein
MTLDVMRRSLQAGVLMAFALDVAPVWAAPEKIPAPAAGVSDSDRMEFTQKDVQAQMQELQDRMFHLADLSKDTEPDNATRLLLAVRKARESLIIEQMNEILDKLSQKDMTSVTSDTKLVLAKLAELKNLLIATDLELQLQLERLRKLQAAIREVDEAIKAEKLQHAQSAAWAKKADAKPTALQKAKTDQAANRTRTENVTASVKSLGNMDAATQPLGASTASMSQAEGSLGGGKPGDAEPMQADATKQLEAAKAALEQERQKTLEQLAKQVKKVVIQNLQEMLDRQTAVREATESLSPKLAKDREAVMKIELLAPPEQRIATICQDTLELVNETEFSVALPPALEELEKNMLLVSGDLTAGHGDQQVIGGEVAIEQDLKDLLDTFKNMQGDGMCNSRCNGCKGDMNKLVAELKVVRTLQMRVNRGTTSADDEARRAAATAALSPELRERIGKLHDGEEGARNAMDLLHQRFAQ